MPKRNVRFEIHLDQVGTDSESQLAYDGLYAVADISQTYSFYLWVSNLLGLQPGEIYLDISCGQGQMPALAQAKGVVSLGLDLSYVALQIGKNENGLTTLVAGNGQQLPYASDSIDVISNIGSLEHYVDMNAAVREMIRVLKPGGRALVLVPNSFSLLHNIWIALRDGYTHVDQQPIQRYATRHEWQDLLQESGFLVDKTVKYEIERPQTIQEWRRYFRHPKKLLRLAMSPFIPLNLAFCFVYLCHKPGK